MVATRNVLLLILLSVPELALTQQSPGSGVATPAQTSAADDPASAQPSRNGQLHLSVLVTDHAGRPVSGLAQSSFTLHDDGRPLPVLDAQPITGQTSASKAPATQVILVIDAVNVPINTVDYEREQVERFLRSNEGRLDLPVSVVIFEDTSTKMQQAPSQDGNALAADLKKQDIGLREVRRSGGFWGATERYDLSLRTLQQLLALEAQRPGHKLVLWISPGWPYLSGPGVDLSGKEQQSLFRSVVDVSNQFQQAQVTLYSIDPLGLNDAGSLHTTYYEAYLKGVRKPSDAQPADLSLQVLATHSGGRVIYGNNDITKQIAHAVSDAMSSYLITTQLPPSDQPGTYHDLDLKVETPGLTAHTTTGYYSRP